MAILPAAPPWRVIGSDQRLDGIARFPRSIQIEISSLRLTYNWVKNLSCESAT